MPGFSDTVITFRLLQTPDDAAHVPFAGLPGLPNPGWPRGRADHRATHRSVLHRRRLTDSGPADPDGEALVRVVPCVPAAAAEPSRRSGSGAVPDAAL